MTRFATNTFAALVAVLMMSASFTTIVTIPAQTTAMASTPVLA